MAAMVQHRFFCINCGNEGIPLYRKSNKLRSKLHRKKLFCIVCNQEVNHVECATEDQIQKFKQDFKNGKYKDEAENSLHYVGTSWGR